MNKLKYIVFAAALLSAAMINLDAYAQREISRSRVLLAGSTDIPSLTN